MTARSGQMFKLRIAFNHIAKTGGTSLLQYFRDHFGEDAVFVYGPHARCSRFFDGKYQLEECVDAQALGAYSVFQGHGVSDSLITLIGDPAIKLMVVLREPVSWTRSRWNQRNIESSRYGNTLSADKFMRTMGSNQTTQNLLKKFGAFADNDCVSDLDRAKSILSKFDFVFTLGKIEAQMEGMVTRYSLPLALQRRRVAEEKTHLPFSDAQIRANNLNDATLFEMAHQVAIEGGGRHHNALGFDAAGRACVVQRLIASRDDAMKQAAEQMYPELASALCAELRAAAALKLIERAPEWVPVRDPSRLRIVLESEWQARAATLGAEYLARSGKIAQRWTQKARLNTLPPQSGA